jgi:hypothetical protein
MVDLKNEEILTCLLIIVVGYFIAKMFSRSCNGFSVGGGNYAPKVKDTNYGFSLYCKGGTSFGMYDSICPGWNENQKFNRFDSKNDATNAIKSFRCIDSESMFADDMCVYNPQQSNDLPYKCGSCPIVGLRCPDECKTKTNMAISLCDGTPQECNDCPIKLNTSENLCIPSEATDSLYIGNLDLEITYKDVNKDEYLINGDLFEKAYKFDITDDSQQWNMYKSTYNEYDKKLNVSSTKVIQPELLATLGKLRSAPYRIDRIALTSIPKINVANEQFIDSTNIFIENTDLPYDYKIKIFSRQVAEQDREFYFTDKTGDIYSLSYPGLSVWDLAEYPHVVDYNSRDNKLMYLSYKYND